MNATSKQWSDRRVGSTILPTLILAPKPHVSLLPVQLSSYSKKRTLCVKLNSVDSRVYTFYILWFFRYCGYFFVTHLDTRSRSQMCKFICCFYELIGNRCLCLNQKINIIEGMFRNIVFELINNALLEIVHITCRWVNDYRLDLHFIRYI